MTKKQQKVLWNHSELFKGKDVPVEIRSRLERDTAPPPEMRRCRSGFASSTS